MSWKKTVMNINQWLDLHGIDRTYRKDMKSTYLHFKTELDMQAEITGDIAFKAGHQAGVEDFPECAKYIEKGRQEVVEWLEEQSTNEANGKLYVFVEAALETQLKKWGIGEE